MGVRYIYLFRHGQTTFNRDRRFTGWKNPRLTAKGIANARAVARQLKGKSFEVAIHTRLTRSKQTLKEVLRFHPECRKIIEDNRVIERSYGVLSGTTHAAFIRRVGRRLVKLDVEKDALEGLSEKKRSEIEQFLGTLEYDLIHRGWNIPPPGGESFAMVEKRVASFIKDLEKMIRKDSVNVAISAHGNSIRLFRKIMEGTSIPETTGWVIPYDKVFTYAIRV